MFPNRDLEVRQVSINNLNGQLRGSSILAQVECKLSRREVITPIFLTLIGKHSKILFDVLILALDFSIALWVIRSSQASFNAEMRVKSAYEAGSEL